MDSPSAASTPKSPRGLTVFGIFILFAMTMACFAGITLGWPGTFLDPIWKLNPRAYAQLAPLGKMVGVPFLLLAVVAAVTAVGWFRRRRWGWWFAVIGTAVQAAGDLFNALSGRFLAGAFGVSVAGLILFYLSRPRVKSAFAARPRS
ncbi:MAG TPA: hypothetical protein VMH00_04790 [Candidatus Limnocylindrales bacterium]|nr:hypothetical protein [Candidatus Limnocylindrales bacterium]